MATANKQPPAKQQPQQKEATSMAIKVGSKGDDYSDMDLSKLAELREQIEAAIKSKSVEEFEKDVNYIATRAKNHRRTLTEYVNAIIKLMSDEERKLFGDSFNPIPRAKSQGDGSRQRAPRGSKPPKVTKDVDSTGERPKLNSKYVDPDTKFEWFTKAQLGRTPQVMLDAVAKAGAWSKLEAK